MTLLLFTISSLSLGDTRIFLSVLPPLKYTATPGRTFGHFSVQKKDRIPNPTEGSSYIIIKRTQLCLCSISAGPYYLQENVLSYEDEKVDLHMYYTVNMAVVNYFGTQIPEIEKIDGHIQIETTDVHEKDLNDPKDQLTVSDILLSEDPVILAVKDLQGESYENEDY